MTIYIPEIEPASLQFPDPNTARTEPNGLLAFGGDLSPQRLRQAYRHGIFPWYSQGEPILWQRVCLQNVVHRPYRGQ